MTIQELEQQLLQLSQTDRQHLATVLNQSLQSVTDDRSEGVERCSTVQG
jgi:hypothetical protein